MAITKFIPTIWSENLIRSLDHEYIGVAHCNREYEGEIKSCGSTVKICGIGNVTIRDYNKNNDMDTPQELSDTVCTLTIDQARCFNFQIDDIDRAQTTPKLMEAAMSVAAKGLAEQADRYVYSLYSQAKHTIYQEEATPDTIWDAIFSAREKLFENGVSDPSQVVFEVSPAIASMIMRAKISAYHDNDEIFENGFLGSVAGCRIYVSNNVVVDKSSGSNFKNQCIMRTRRAVAFAEQLSEIEAYRPEKRFADAVKGLHLYGAAIVCPDEYIRIELGSPAI